jgi:hypothetical protein
VKEVIRGELFQSVINYIRKHSKDEIDDAYEFFWEAEYPEDFLLGTALELALMNFEDWLVCDYKNKENKSMVDSYLEENDTDDETKGALHAMRDSVIGFYEVVSGDDSEKVLRDLVMDAEIRTKDQAFTELNVGDVFASRIFEHNGEYVMGRCVYPFNQGAKDTVLGYLDNQYRRYVKNKNPEGTKRQFLKDEAYFFNVVWINAIFKMKNA